MTGRAHPLFGGRTLAQWIRAGGQPERGPVGYFQRLRWHAYWFEHNWRSQVKALAAIELPEDPVFILGLWRSGTTVFHELLAPTSRWYTPQTWQCFNPSTCFQTAPPSRHSSIGRPMDRGLISTNSPQEDEFALLLLGEPSVYRGFIDPRRLRECGQELWQPQDSAMQRWQDFLRCGLQGTQTRQLLLKSPSHTFRLPVLRLLFPRARFIWIGRHIGEVLASNRRMWREMAKRYALWNCPEETLEGFLQDMLEATCGVLTQCLDGMPQDRLLWVDFEQLRSEPRSVMHRVLRFLDPKAPIEGLERALLQTPVYNGSPARLPSGSAHVQRLHTLIAAARQRFGPAAAGYER